MFLAHSTSIDNVRSILKDGFMLTHIDQAKLGRDINWYQSYPSREPELDDPEDWYLSGMSGVYFSIVTSLLPSNVYFCFHLSLIEQRDDWYASNGDYFGYANFRNGHSVRTVKALKQQRYYQDSILNEVIFLNKVPLCNATLVIENCPDDVYELAKQHKIQIVPSASLLDLRVFTGKVDQPFVLPCDISKIPWDDNECEVTMFDFISNIIDTP